MFLKAKIWYNDYVVTPILITEGGGIGLKYIAAVLVAVAAQVIAYYLCKWLDSHTKDN